MGWIEMSVTNWAELSALFDNLQIGRTGDPSWCFRGQANASWDLKPSILRLFGDRGISHKKAHGIENGVFRRFMAEAHLHFGTDLPPPNINPAPGWWILMQHHHCPTRLLDWTKSPYVAAYFAVEQLTGLDRAIWILPSSPLETQMTHEFGRMFENYENMCFFSDAPEQAIYPICGIMHSDRSVAQQGVYTVSTDILADHAPLIQASLAKTSWAKHFVKVIVPSSLKHEGLYRLRTMNITASSLFPGPDGVGKAASEYVRIRIWDELAEATEQRH
ncbi:MAG: FRG domain-containing protein [Desulfomonilia bacterium]